MPKVKFKYQEESFVYPKLIDAVNKLCEYKGKSCTCTSGYRSIEKQKIINAQVLLQHKNQGAYQLTNGAVYTPDGKCWASAYGKSNHCYCIAMDIGDSWFENLTNTQLKQFGLVKTMTHEPWHVTLIKLVEISDDKKKLIRDTVLKGVSKDMNVKEFQVFAGLECDGIAGSKTKAKAKEVLQCCQKILGLNYQTAEEVINDCMTKPTIWLAMLKTVPYFKSFVMNIVKKMGGQV